MRITSVIRILFQRITWREVMDYMEENDGKTLSYKTIQNIWNQQITVLYLQHNK